MGAQRSEEKLVELMTNGGINITKILSLYFQMKSQD